MIFPSPLVGILRDFSGSRGISVGILPPIFPDESVIYRIMAGSKSCLSIIKTAAREHLKAYKAG
jgi:hypothetical protein